MCDLKACTPLAGIGQAELGAGVGPGLAWKLDQGLGVAVPAAEGGQGDSEMMVCAACCRA